jgi:hypothetical protein
VRDDVLGFCLQVLETVKFAPGEQIVLDGVRHKEVLASLTVISPLQEIRLIYLAAAVETRKARTSSTTELTIIDSHKVESQTNTELKALADFVIYTEGTADQSFSRLLSWIRSEEALGEGLPTT